MNISDITLSQALQNAMSHTESSGRQMSAARSAAVREAPAGSSQQSPAPHVAPRSLIIGIDYIKQQLDMLLNSYPPYFPIGTFQRADLIRGIRGIEDQVSRAPVEPGLKKSIAKNRLPDNASDQQISESLDRLFAVRNSLAQNNAVAAQKVQPGTLLDVKV